MGASVRMQEMVGAIYIQHVSDLIRRKTNVTNTKRTGRQLHPSRLRHNTTFKKSPTESKKMDMRGLSTFISDIRKAGLRYIYIAFIINLCHLLQTYGSVPYCKFRECDSTASTVTGGAHSPSRLFLFLVAACSRCLQKWTKAKSSNDCKSICCK